MRRREFIAGLGGAAVWPAVARAQPSGMPVIGILGSSTAEGFAPRLAAFGQGLNESGFVEGRNLAMEFRWANDQLDRLPDMATVHIAPLAVALLAQHQLVVDRAGAGSN